MINIENFITKKIRITIRKANMDFFFTGRISSHDRDFIYFSDKFDKQVIIRKDSVINVEEVE